MSPVRPRSRLLILGPFLALALLLAGGALVAFEERPADGELTLVVMDPLAAPLSCPCVKGYAQRDYDKLAAHLRNKLNRKVKVVYNDSLTAALKQSGGKADLVIGKRSVVEFDAHNNKLNLTLLAALTGKDGATTQTGLLVVPKDDPAKSPADLKGYRIIFGTKECDEKYTAALALLEKHKVPAPGKIETCSSCSDGATAILALGKDVRGAAVISSYAKPLLEGCGTIKRGDLRVVGETAPVPFITAFAADSLPAVERKQIAEVLLKLAGDPALCQALETQRGFVEEKTRPGLAKKKLTDPEPAQAWTGWRGPERTGLVPALPARLPDKPRFLWKKQLSNQALAGVAASADYVIVADRDLADSGDVFRCLNASNGEEVWALRYLARGQLDYGFSPRATPLIHGEVVFLYGAFGHLHCVELKTGKVLWKKNIRTEFGADDKMVWGMSSSPLIVDGKLIVNPGAREASLVALEPLTGKVVWKTPGVGAAFASFIVAEFGGKKQLVGYDKDSLGGWDVQTGKRLWKLTPPHKNDYNVPTPIQVGERLLVSTENNGTRLYGFDKEGRILPKPLAENSDLSPETHTPVAVGKRLFGVWNALYCLDLEQGLKEVWTGEDNAFTQHASIIASPERLLICTHQGELLLIDARADRYKVISRLRVFEDESGVYSHPALVGDRLYLRGSSEIACVLLQAPEGKDKER